MQSEGIHSGFETQRRRHQKYKTVASVAAQKGLMTKKNIKLFDQVLRIYINTVMCHFWQFYLSID